MFEKTRLYTPEGGFVVEVELPPFLTKPEVLIWGARVFVHVDSFLDLTEDEDGCYVEAFAYYVPLYPPPFIDLLESTNMDAGDGEPIIIPDPNLCREGMPSPEEVKEGMDLLEATYGKCPACNRVDGRHMPDCPSYEELPAPDHFINRRFQDAPPSERQLEKLREVKPSPPRRVRMIGEPFNCGYCHNRFSFMGLDRNPQDESGATYCTAAHLRLAGCCPRCGLQGKTNPLPCPIHHDSRG